MSEASNGPWDPRRWIKVFDSKLVLLTIHFLAITTSKLYHHSPFINNHTSYTLTALPQIHPLLYSTAEICIYVQCVHTWNTFTQSAVHTCMHCVMHVQYMLILCNTTCTHTQFPGDKFPLLCGWISTYKNCKHDSFYACMYVAAAVNWDLQVFCQCSSESWHRFAVSN